MLIDSTRLMYAAFMEARWAMPATGSLLVVLDDVLDVTIQQQALVVTVPDVWLTRVDDFARHLVFAGPKRLAIGPLAGSNEDLFTLVRTATTELRRLWSIQATEAVRALGHVMSRDARLLSHPGRKRGDSAEVVPPSGDVATVVEDFRSRQLLPFVFWRFLLLLPGRLLRCSVEEARYCACSRPDRCSPTTCCATSVPKSIKVKAAFSTSASVSVTATGRKRAAFLNVSHRDTFASVPEGWQASHFPVAKEYLQNFHANTERRLWNAAVMLEAVSQGQKLFHHVAAGRSDLVYLGRVRERSVSGNRADCPFDLQVRVFANLSFAC
jgi:hypothetical protein